MSWKDRVNSILNTLMAAITIMFMVLALFRVYDWHNNTELYEELYEKTQTPWYMSIVVMGVCAAAVIIICFIIKFFINRNNNHKKQE